MRICFFAETYVPIISGTSISLQRMTGELRSRGHQICVVTAAYPGISEREKDVVRYKSIPLPRRFDFRLGLPSSAQLLPALRQFDPDIVHTQQPFLAGRVAQQLARALGVPVVATIHTQYDHEHYLHYASPIPFSWTRSILRRVLRDFCNCCASVVTPSQGMANRLADMGVVIPITVIPNGLDIASYAQASPWEFRAEHGWEGLKLLLFVGRLTREKNLRFLLRSYRLMARTGRNHLILVGDGPDRKDLEQLTADLGLSDNVSFLGWVSPKEVPGIYRGADVFVMPSITEVNPLCLSEALASGIPVVAVDTFSARECLHDGVDSILTPYNSLDFCEAVVRLLEDSETHHSMCLHALANSQAYALPKKADALLELYRTLLLRQSPCQADGFGCTDLAQ